MFRPTILGLGACAIGIVMAIFEAIGSTMTAGKVVLQNATLLSVLGDERMAWIEDISWSLAQDGITFVVNVPIFAIVITLGLLLILVGMIFK